MKSSPLPKGFALEELLRVYFLQNGFYVLRGVPYKLNGDDLTDIDLWLYERSTGTSRRVLICDAKFKQRPKAIERLFWTKGVGDSLKVDGIFVATTDKRDSLQIMAKRLGIHLIDGDDIQRIKNNPLSKIDRRLSSEEFVLLLRKADKVAHNKMMEEAQQDVLASILEGFGIISAVRSLDWFSKIAAKVVTCHPNSETALASGRLAFFFASILCQSLDFISVNAILRPIAELKQLMLNALRYGALGTVDSSQMFNFSKLLIERYSPGGKATANMIEIAFTKDLESIPADIIVDQAIKTAVGGSLFNVGMQLEKIAYANNLINFDMLPSQAKSMIGAMLDYSSVSRQKFAESWESPIMEEVVAEDGNKSQEFKLKP